MISSQKAPAKSSGSDGELPLIEYLFTFPGQKPFKAKGNTFIEALLAKGYKPDDWAVDGFEWTKIRDVPFSWE